MSGGLSGKQKAAELQLLQIVYITFLNVNPTLIKYPLFDLFCKFKSCLNLDGFDTSRVKAKLYICIRIFLFLHVY